MADVLYAVSPSRLYFDHYNDRSGLTSNSVSYILQDRQGFIWVATKDGLNRFDGFNFRHVDTGERESCNFVNTIYEDGDGMIWVGAHNGAFIYDPETEHIRKLTVPRDNGVSITQPVIQFLSDKEGNILMLVDSDGVYAYNKKSGKLKPLYQSKKIKVNQAVYDPTGKLWVGTFGQGLFYTEDGWKTLKRFDLGADSNPQTVIISDMKIKGDKLYVATERLGVLAIDVNTNQLKRIFTDDQKGVASYIRQIMFDGQGLLYIASENGVFIYDLLKGEAVNHLTHNIFDRYSISDNAIYALLCDREGGIWVGSYFGGIDYADTGRMKFDKYYPDNSRNALSGQRVRELCEDPATGRIYVGTEDHGLNCFDPSTGSFSAVEGIDSKNVHALCVDNRQLWVGTFSQGLKIKNLDTGAIKEYNTSRGLVNDYVFAIDRTLNGEIVIGTMGGLQVYDKGSDSFRAIPEFAGIFIYDILEDLKGNLWVATYDHGLYMRQAAQSRWTRFQWDAANPDGIPSDKVYGVYQDAEGVIWVMTQDGLCTYNPEDSSFGRNHLGIDRIKGVVYQVADDDYGRLWLTTNHGLYCLDRKTSNMRRFSASGGLPSNQFNYRSSLKSDDGRMYFGTIEGLVGFQPVGFNFNNQTISPV
ncbi:MAG: hybrid sensor histidine kinase/response regulator, partial [Muribaculaceae bacterium]|nr:hybrid sensor histidine kinase/response regulator [Muribaculaceae bacterium]